jgi:hypothetical protein
LLGAAIRVASEGVRASDFFEDAASIVPPMNPPNSLRENISDASARQTASITMMLVDDVKFCFT